jgi:hypothetical protein
MATHERALSKPPRGFYVHAVLLAASVAAAVGVWTRDKAPKALATGDVTVWSGKPSDLSRVHYESKTKTVDLDAKKDDAGRYFVGLVKLTKKDPPPDADAGAPATPKSNEPVTLVSVGEAQKLAELVAPLKALRALGKIASDREAEFGLSEPDGTLTLQIGGTEHKLVIGASTPGGADRYVRDGQSGEVFAIKGDVVRPLESAESRMVERDLHEWKDADVGSAKVTAGSKSRDMIRGGTEGKRFWADTSAPDTNDETLGNWVSKLDRLRPLEFAAGPPQGKETVLRVDYLGPNKKALGYLELAKAPGEGGKSNYFIASERTRLFAKVTQSVGEQVEQDLATLVK